MPLSSNRRWQRSARGATRRTGRYVGQVSIARSSHESGRVFKLLSFFGYWGWMALPLASPYSLIRSPIQQRKTHYSTVLPSLDFENKLHPRGKYAPVQNHGRFACFFHCSSRQIGRLSRAPRLRSNRSGLVGTLQPMPSLPLREILPNRASS